MGDQRDARDLRQPSQDYDRSYGTRSYDAPDDGVADAESADDGTGPDDAPAQATDADGRDQKP